MKKRDIIIIVAVLAVAGILAVISYGFLHQGGPQDMVEIKLNGQLYEAAPLNEDKVIEVKQGEYTNHIEIKDGVVCMKESNCVNQDCVGMGTMSAENPGIMFGVIVCLPHRVSIELKLASEENG